MLNSAVLLKAIPSVRLSVIDGPHLNGSIEYRNAIEKYAASFALGVCRRTFEATESSDIFFFDTVYIFPSYFRDKRYCYRQCFFVTVRAGTAYRKI